MPFDIKGKVAVITGGVSGIGFQNALELLYNGVKVSFSILFHEYSSTY